jgi:hypothetical protein
MRRRLALLVLASLGKAVTRTRNGNKPFIQRTSLAHGVEIALWKLGGVTTASEET